MTDHKGLPVAGYQPQTQSAVDLANEGKELEERYLRWLDKMQAEYNEWDRNGTSTEPPFDPRCLIEARNHIQAGAMWAIRAIFKPQRIKLPGE